MKKLQIFKNEQFGEIRVIMKENEPWFVANDACRILAIANPRDALNRLDNDERDVVLTDTLGGKQELNVVNEPGLYTLVLGSRKPEAKNFKRWLTHEVIPSIRKTGTYSTDGEKSKNQFKKEEVEAKLNNSRARLAQVWLKIAERVNIPEYKQIMSAKAAETLAGQAILPLPTAERPTYSAKEIGIKFGVSGNKIGKLANQYNLKTPEYGKLFYDKSPHSCKEVETWRYYDTVIPIIEQLPGKEVLIKC